MSGSVTYSNVPEIRKGIEQDLPPDLRVLSSRTETNSVRFQDFLKRPIAEKLRFAVRIGD